jgi:hypothetical protein
MRYAIQPWLREDVAVDPLTVPSRAPLPLPIGLWGSATNLARRHRSLQQPVGAGNRLDRACLSPQTND